MLICQRHRNNTREEFDILPTPGMNPNGDLGESYRNPVRVLRGSIRLYAAASAPRQDEGDGEDEDDAESDAGPGHDAQPGRYECAELNSLRGGARGKPAHQVHLGLPGTIGQALGGGEAHVS